MTSFWVFDIPIFWQLRHCQKLFVPLGCCILQICDSFVNQFYCCLKYIERKPPWNSILIGRPHRLRIIICYAVPLGASCKTLIDGSHVMYFNMGTICYIILTICDLTLCDLTSFFFEISVTICSSFCLLETLA